MSVITSHVLDAALGRPAAGVGVRLTDGDGRSVAEATTDADGRISDLGSSCAEALPAGTYRLVFATGAYFAAQQRECFYPEISIAFTVTDPDAQYHVPLLLSPFAYSTYRGS